MSGIDETHVTGTAGKDTRGLAVGGVHPAPALPDKTLAQLRATGLVPPRGPRPGLAWAPRTAAETHLLNEGRRLDRARQLLLAEVGRLRHHLGIHAGGKEKRQAAARAATLRARCPLSPALLNVLTGAARGESAEETATRLYVSYETVRTNRQRAVQRLEARTVSHAVAIAVAAGWVTPDQINGGDPR